MFWWLEICWELIDNKTTENLVCKFKFESTQEQVRTFQQHVLSQSFHQTTPGVILRTFLNTQVCGMKTCNALFYVFIKQN